MIVFKLKVKLFRYSGYNGYNGYNRNNGYNNNGYNNGGLFGILGK